ncbi:Agamous-like MADS-box protein AGL93 [Morus notabilis]|uniref:Agamous-like MADS-box protein AGL93 n=1 Tax=Morus notabilis TaxID=981085 RepID=W9RRT5_9ROSA|nr:agamous-like MADS-box protein AGL103 [Morus notabilis]EXC05022.1 Agamous-like MADS-box protein AGL93 [Morus notabilis]
MEKSKKKVFERRRSTLKKKAGELADRCNVDVCVVCFGPDGDLQVWPENPTEAQSIIGKYIEATKEGNKCKRTEKLDLSDILEAKIKKLEKQALEEEKTWDNFDIRNVGGLSLWDEELAALSESSLTGLSDCLEAKIQSLTERIELFKGKQTMPSSDYCVF